RHGKYFVSGMRDPLAVEPSKLLHDTSSLSPDKVEARWATYHSLYPEFVLARAQTVLSPPTSLTLSLKDGELSASGVASTAWLSDARRLAPAISGITTFRADNVIDEQILQFKAKMEQEVPRFVVGTSRFVPGQDAMRQRLIDDALGLFALARSNNVRIRMTVVGHTDDTGPAELNERLSQERAESIKTLLIGAGVDGDLLDATGVGAREPVPADSSGPGSEINRSVTFRVALDNTRPAKKP
ncbi:MAG: OmpA family protein, partial [Acidobacteriota bacterium]